MSIQIQDFRVIIAALTAAYPRDNFMPNEYTFNLWYSMLQDLSYPALDRAAKSYIMGNKYPPTIADIRQLANDLTAPPGFLAGEEWTRLMKALGQAGSTDALRYWNSLPEITREIVGGFSEFKEWAHSPTCDLIAVQRPMFIKRYEEKAMQRRRQAAVPPSFRIPKRELSEDPVPVLEEKRSQGERAAPPSDMIERLKARLHL